MTEHKDVTGAEIIAVNEAIASGGFSWDSITAVERHLEREHNNLEKGTVEELVVRMRHNAAILKGEIRPENL